jgi:hypothetical protein
MAAPSLSPSHAQHPASSILHPGGGDQSSPPGIPASGGTRLGARKAPLANGRRGSHSISANGMEKADGRDERERRKQEIEIRTTLSKWKKGRQAGRRPGRREEERLEMRGVMAGEIASRQLGSLGCCFPCFSLDPWTDMRCYCRRSGNGIRRKRRKLGGRQAG